MQIVCQLGKDHMMKDNLQNLVNIYLNNISNCMKTKYHLYIYIILCIVCIEIHVYVTLFLFLK